MHTVITMYTSLNWKLIHKLSKTTHYILPTQWSVLVQLIQVSKYSLNRLMPNLMQLTVTSTSTFLCIRVCVRILVTLSHSCVDLLCVESDFWPPSSAEHSLPDQSDIFQTWSDLFIVQLQSSALQITLWCCTHIEWKVKKLNYVQNKDSRAKE